VKIFLLGLPGAGKSWLGKSVAALIHLPFIDLDEQIQLREGMDVQEIFKTKGEDYFRRVEAEMLREKIKQPEFVMATGGGTPCFFENIGLMNSVGTSIFLDTPVSIIAKRLNADEKGARPLLSNSTDVEKALYDLLEKRKSFYSKAHFTVRGESVKIQEIIDRVASVNKRI
jgi:shikimate kinase